MSLVNLSNLEWSILLPGLVAVAAVAGWLSLIDWREHRLPNNIVGPLAAGVAIWILAMGVVLDDLGRSMVALGWGWVGLAVFLVLHLVAGMGMGDVKYAWPLCATLGWFGWPSVQVGLYALLISGGIVGLFVRFQGKSGSHCVAYGPYMSVGLVCGILAGVTA